MGNHWFETRELGNRGKWGLKSQSCHNNNIHKYKNEVGCRDDTVL